MSLIDRIKFDGSSDVLVWKWRRADSDRPAEDLTLGAQLIVNEGQEAVFYKGGQALDLFGPGTHTLATGNLPLLRKIINLPFGGQTPFAAEVYFINKSVSLAKDWGSKTPVVLLDPRYRVTIPLRGYGSYAIRVANSREFLVQLVGASAGALADTTAWNLLNSPILSCVQQGFGDFLVKQKICALDLPAHTIELGQHVAELLREHYRTFGVALLNFAVESISFDPSDNSVERLRAMLDEAARLEVLGDAARRNQDFYRADRQFDVLKTAAQTHGPTGELLAAGLGVGLGFGMARPAGELAKEAMAPQSLSAPTCPQCGTPYNAGTKFCAECGTKFSSGTVPCPHCKVENVPSVKFCVNCGQSFHSTTCANCGATIAAGASFCGQCGEKR
jgi:membrane protease subunit (stomatin/prohibitin family)